jgi:hypothetical protein
MDEAITEAEAEKISKVIKRLCELPLRKRRRAIKELLELVGGPR